MTFKFFWDQLSKSSGRIVKEIEKSRLSKTLIRIYHKNSINQNTLMKDFITCIIAVTLQLIFKLFFSVIDYCKSDDENEDFENFCKQFLPNDITVKKIRQRQQSPKLLAMVLIPIVDGRDNLLEYLRKLIEDTISNNHINGK